MTVKDHYCEIEAYWWILTVSRVFTIVKNVTSVATLTVSTFVFEKTYYERVRSG